MDKEFFVYGPTQGIRKWRAPALVYSAARLVSPSSSCDFPQTPWFGDHQTGVSGTQREGAPQWK
jgi:hypothetical protein